MTTPIRRGRAQDLHHPAAAGAHSPALRHRLLWRGWWWWTSEFRFCTPDPSLPDGTPSCCTGASFRSINTPGLSRMDDSAAGKRSHRRFRRNPAGAGPPSALCAALCSGGHGGLAARLPYCTTGGGIFLQLCRRSPNGLRAQMDLKPTLSIVHDMASSSFPGSLCSFRLSYHAELTPSQLPKERSGAFEVCFPEGTGPGGLEGSLVALPLG